MKSERLIFLIPVLISCRLLSQQPDPLGVWVPEKPKWHHAPRNVDRHLRDSQVELLLFKNDGRFVLMYCTIYRRMESLNVSEGDAESVYLGSWESSGAKIEITYQLKYRDIPTTGDEAQAYAQKHGEAQRLGKNLIMWDGMKFHPEVRLENSVEQRIQGFLNPAQ